MVHPALECRGGGHATGSQGRQEGWGSLLRASQHACSPSASFQRDPGKPRICEWPTLLGPRWVSVLPGGGSHAHQGRCVGRAPGTSRRTQAWDPGGQDSVTWEQHRRAPQGTAEHWRGAAMAQAPPSTSATCRQPRPPWGRVVAEGGAGRSPSLDKPLTRARGGRATRMPFPSRS